MRPNSAGNTIRPLTPSLDLGKEGLMPNHTDCVLPWAGTTAVYQALAKAAYESASDLDLTPWTWMVATCGGQCVNPEHLIARSPVNLAYPRGVCVYCGLPSAGKDHLLPRSLTGDARRQLVAVVPSCAECNSAINDTPTASITQRRAIAHGSIRRRKRGILAAPTWTDGDLAELGPTLRSAVRARQDVKRATLLRLGWPDDPFYDLRALEKSGIDNGYAIGLIDPERVAS